jgi:hypothetical protein
MVGQGLDALAAQPLRRRLDLDARQAVDDAGLVRMLAPDEGQQLRLRILLRHDAVADVRPVEAGDEDAAVLQLQPLGDVAPGRAVGGGGQGDARHAGIARCQRVQLQVFRAEVVAPLRHAMRLVDREQGQLAVVEHVEQPVGQQPLGRDIQQVELARPHRPGDVARFAGRQGRVQRRGADAELAQRLDLVLHQRDQRRHHDAEARPHQRRHLVAQRLAAAGRHQHQRVAAGNHLGHDLGLLAAEGGIAEDVVQDCKGVEGHPPLIAGGGVRTKCRLRSAF